MTIESGGKKSVSGGHEKRPLYRTVRVVREWIKIGHAKKQMTTILQYLQEGFNDLAERLSDDFTPQHCLQRLRDSFPFKVDQ